MRRVAGLGACFKEGGAPLIRLGKHDHLDAAIRVLEGEHRHPVAPAGLNWRQAATPTTVGSHSSSACRQSVAVRPTSVRCDLGGELFRRVHRRPRFWVVMNPRNYAEPPLGLSRRRPAEQRTAAAEPEPLWRGLGTAIVTARFGTRWRIGNGRIRHAPSRNCAAAVTARKRHALPMITALLCRIRRRRLTGSQPRENSRSAQEFVIRHARVSGLRLR
jgi:hypothetical protein